MASDDTEPLLSEPNIQCVTPVADPSALDENQVTPVDRYNLVYVLVYILGFTALLPWNMFITAKGYFMYQLRNASAPADLYDDPGSRTSLQIYYESSVALAYMIVNVLMSLAVTQIIDRISARKRIVGGILIVLCLLTLTLALTKVNVSHWQAAFFFVTMATVVILSACCSMVGASLFGLLAHFPLAYIQSCMAGGAVAGIFSTAASLVTISINGSVVDSGFWYFLSSVLAILLALLAFGLLYTLEFSRYYLAIHARNSVPAHSGPHPAAGFIARLGLLWKVFRSMTTYSASVVIVATVTLMLYPATTSSVQSVDKDDGSVWTGKYFLPLYCFLVFNVGDLAGRTMAAWFDLPKPAITMPLTSCLRLLFVPLFMLCNVQPRSYLPVVFASDAYPVVFMSLFSFTNGYLMTKCLMQGPKSAPSDRRELGGVVMSVSMTVGLAVGSGLSYLMVLLVSAL